MAFEPNAVLLSYLLGFVGLGLLIYGRRTRRGPHLVAGALFVAYPYFVQDTVWLLGVGAVIAIGLWYVVRMDW